MAAVTDSKAYYLILKLGKQGNHDLNKFLDSPFHNTNRTLFFIHQILAEFAEAKQNPENQEVWLELQTRLNTSEFYSEPTLRKLISKLQKKIEEMILVQFTLSGEKGWQPARLLLSMEALKKYDNDKAISFFDVKLQSILDGITEGPEKALASYFHKKFQADYFRFGSARDKYPTHHAQILSALDRFFIMARLKLVALGTDQALSLGNVPKPVLSDLNEEVIKLYGNEVSGMAFIQIYLGIIKIQEYAEQENRIAEIRILSKLFSDKFHQLPSEDQYIGYVLILNMLARSLNRYHEDTIVLSAELLEWSLFGFDNKFIVGKNGKVAAGIIKNVIELGLRCDRVQLVEKVIQEYGHNIQSKDDSISNIMEFFEMNILVYHEKWSEAGGKLLQTKFKDVFFEVGSNVLRLKIFYELNDLDSFNRLIKRFYEFIRTNRVLNDNQKELYKNRLNWYRMLSRTQLPTEWVNLRNELHDGDYFEDQAWILKHVNRHFD